MSAQGEADATRAVDAAARKAWEDARDRARAGGWEVPPSWDDLDKARKRNLKEQVLPIVWAALEVIPSASEVRDQVAREIERHAAAEAQRLHHEGTPGLAGNWVGGIREAGRVVRGEVAP